ncbi:hypothetical protein BCR42DRAFT_231398 [Absidia repens]|uniref:Phospholipid/glycerol acyltransferase domain-containing protein n=1 Tax=Absidia repens TaxID=90262 RepID=A0A1X2ILN8_9FUNG|nr:hypothetical protein BCR42DRAFT_231398 [Absidia repens]
MLKHTFAKLLLKNYGAVPVDRTTKENALLYSSTFEVLRLGEAVVLFPEGTSHTLPRLRLYKDVVSFAALEYAKLLTENPHPNFKGLLPKQTAVLPVGVVYLNKSEHRSVVIVRYGEPISVDKYLKIYMVPSSRQGTSK